MRVAGLGPVVQVAYIVNDLHDAIRQWTSKLGVGPFFALEHVKYPEHEVDGVSGPLELSLGFAFSGELQIELMQQHGDYPSVVTAYPPSPVNGLHHVGILSDNMAVDEARLTAAGLRPVGSCVSEIGVRCAFFHGGPHLGGLIELIQCNDPVSSFFDANKRAAAQWDGSTPYGTPPG